MDWSGCELVEVIPGKVSGMPLVKGTRIPADVIVSNFDAGSPVDEICECVRFLMFSSSKQSVISCRPILV